MNTMQTVLLLVAFAATAFGAWPGGLRIRFGVGVGIGSSFFYEMPRTVSEAKTKRFQQTERPEGPMPSLVMYCTGEYIFCTLYDDLEKIAGIQIAIPSDKFKDGIYDWKAQGFTSWTPTGDTVYWAIQQYFISEGILALDPEDRLDAFDDSRTLQYGAVWLTGFNGELLRVSTAQEDIQNSVFTEQACIPWMGHHYYYNMTENLPCNENTIYPWFPLTASDELIGMGFLLPGKLPADEIETYYFENPDKTAVQAIVPHGPQCLYDLADDPAIITMHIYYIDNPWLITCIFQ